MEKTITEGTLRAVTVCTWKGENKEVHTFRSVFGAGGPPCPVCGQKIGSKHCKNYENGKAHLEKAD